jgi:glycosyltransferase involved in cell wall biosynthesis
MDPISDKTAYSEVKKIIKDFKPEIVHTHASKAGAIGRLAAYNLKIPVIVHTYHGHVFNAYFNGFVSSVYKIVERNLAKKTDAIIALSQRQKYDLVKKYKVCKEAQTHIITNGFNLSNFQNGVEEKRKKFREHYQLDENEFAIGIIGRMVPVKNHEMFVNVIERVSQIFDGKIRYFIVGDGETLKKTQNQLIEKNISFTENNDKATVHFTSWQKDITETMFGLDIVALTSLNEGTPVCLIEAQAANCPIVSTDVGGIRDIVIDGETALLSPSNDVEAMSNNIVNLITNKELYKKLKSKGAIFANAHFQHTEMVSKTKELYRKLLTKKNISF